MPNLFPITDFADPALDVYARLTENRLVNRVTCRKGFSSRKAPRSSSGR